MLSQSNAAQSLWLRLQLGITSALAGTAQQQYHTPQRALQHSCKQALDRSYCQLWCIHARQLGSNSSHGVQQKSAGLTQLHC
jgi:hypothetical protein